MWDLSVCFDTHERWPSSRPGRWPNAAAPITPWFTSCWRKVLASGRLPDISAGQELVVGQKPRPSLVDPFKPYLLRRIGEGRVNCIARSPLKVSPAVTRSSEGSSSSTAANLT
jgi:hypothetical protein